MSGKAKLILGITILSGCIFLGLAIYQWCSLYQIEQGLAEGKLSSILHQVYQAAGKWGVAAIYMPFSIYSFWRAYGMIKAHKEESGYGTYDDDNENEIGG